jgi:hypothetical protein
VKQISVTFKKWDLIAWLNEQGADARVAVRPICEAIGVDWAGQSVKIQNDPKFNCCDIAMVAEDGKPRMMVTLPVEQIQGWLFSINSRKVSPQVAPLLLTFQQDLFRVIYAATSGQVSPEIVASLQACIEELRETIREQAGRIDDLTAQVAYMSESVLENCKEIAETRKMVIEPINTGVSNAARTLRKGHLKN